MTWLLCSKFPFQSQFIVQILNYFVIFLLSRTAQGLCKYIQEQYPEKSTWAERGIVIGYDGRYHSKRFAELTAIVFSSNNFRVHLYKRYVATPIIPYSITKLQCLAGVQVTASHNPKDDNGYKV